MKKFENRIALFNEILSEVYKFYVNYKEELNKLNINIKQIITQHSNKLQTGVAKRTLSKYSNEDPFSDILISDSVQQLLNYYLNKHSLVSEEAEEIKNIISQDLNNISNKENLKILKQEEQKINSNLLNLNKAKNKYYAMMSKLEEQITKIEENKKKAINNKSNLTNSTNSNAPKTKKEKKDEDKKEEKKMDEHKINSYMIEEVVRTKESYMLALDTLNLTKREYLNSLNLFNDKIKEFDINENDVLNKVLQTFDKYYKMSQDKIKELSDIILENKNSEKENKVFIDKINKKYEFEEYIPQHNKINSNEDLYVLTEMNKYTGFNIEESFSDPKVKKEIKFILCLEKIINNCSTVKKAEIDSMKEFLKENDYINKFLVRLNKARVDKELDKDKMVFDIIVELFNYMLENLVVDSKTNHDVIKSLLIMTQSFYINDENNNNKKIFFSNKIDTPKEFKTSEFWIEFIEKEIENNKNETDGQKEDENKSNQNNALMQFIGNISNLNDYLSNESKIKDVFTYFEQKYSFNEENIKNVSDIMGFHIK
jgi:hypothetical protein